jgi:CTP-dependent riboflavin kinase
VITRRIILCAALAWPCAAQGLSIAGKVRGTNVPLEGATVTLSSLSTGRRITQANAEGEFAFSGLDNGPYQVTFEHPGYRTATVRVALGYDPDTGEVNITLQPE